MRKYAVLAGIIFAVTALLLTQGRVTTRSADAQDPDQSVAGGSIAEGWAVRTDRGASLDGVKVVESQDGLDVTVGPAIVLYREADTASGNYEVSASLTQKRAPQHYEAYGLFIGGRDLQGDDQTYTYFLIRGDGKYLIKRRLGERTTTISRWTDHAAVNVPDEAGRATNTLAIAVADGRCSFRINGSEVASMTADELDTEGIAGLRVNHNLDVRVTDFTIAGP